MTEPKTTLSFHQYRDRYHYDFKACLPRDGWQQYDTKQDAPYFGIWVNAERRQVLTFAEGDETLEEFADDISFNRALKSMAEFYGPPPAAFTVVDEDGKATRYCDERPGGEK